MISHNSSTDAWEGSLVIGIGIAVFDGPGGSVSRHRHDAVQVIACAERDVVVEFDSTIVSDRVVTIPSRAWHRVECAAAWVTIALVEPSAFNRDEMDLPSGAIDPVTVERVVGTSSVATGPSDVLRRGLQLVEAVGGSPVAARRAQHRPEVARAIELIESGVGRIPRLDEVAATVSLSPSRLSRVFAAEAGLPFRRFVLWARLRRAALAVRDGADLTTASAEAGFSDSAHLSRVFRATFGLTPSHVLPILDVADLRQ